jgi:hypothetical protein
MTMGWLKEESWVALLAFVILAVTVLRLAST